MMRFAPLLLFLALTACLPGNRLTQGRYTGTLTPMNHPDMQTPVTFDIAYERADLTIALVGPDGQTIPTRDVIHAPPNLFFTFDEPEEGVTLRCVWARQEDDGWAGRCTDSEGKWARFEIAPDGT
ncbi:MAG: hypothetical protein AAGI52_13145 [Bacteroidota bacterium]